MRLKYMLGRTGAGWRDDRPRLGSMMALGWLLLVPGCFDFDSLRRGDGNNGSLCTAPAQPTPGALVATCIPDDAPRIDGQLSDWPSEFPYEVSYTTSALFGGSMPFVGDTTVDNADSSATIAVRWDESYLYVAARIRDNARGAYVNTSAIYEDDSIEIFIDGNGDRGGAYGQDDLQCIFRADGTAQLLRQQQATGQSCGTFKMGSGEDANWTLEVAFPWSLLGSQSPSSGRLLGFDIVLNDDDNVADQEQKHFLIWRDETPQACPSLCVADLPCRPTCSTSTFALLQLGGG